MCGPYVHGRSWAITGIKGSNNNWWRQAQTGKTFDSKTLKEMQEMFDSVVMKDVKQKVKDDFMDTFLYGKPKYLAIDPAMKTGKVEAPKEVQIEYDGKRQIQEYKHFCKRMECNAHNEMPTDVYPTKNKIYTRFDWGIQSWDGKVVNQRTLMDPRLKMEIENQGYMMNTKEDLLAWCTKHWGTHMDEGEWASSAYRFFDLNKFLSFLPLKYKEGLHESRLETLAGQLAHGLLIDSDKPVEVFADMLDDAPNDYWKNK